MLTPWSTLPSIALIALLLVFAATISRKKPLVSFCIFFFFLNHVIEGSLIPLELIYEHRNYIPSFFFFVSVAIGMLWVIDYFSYKKVLQFTIAAVFTFMLFAQGHTVFIRNSLFINPIQLWTDNIKKAPNLSRPHGNLGSYLSRNGDWISATKQYTLALELRNFINFNNEPEMYHANLAKCYLNLGQEHLAIQECEKFLIIGKKQINAETCNTMAVALVSDGKLVRSNTFIHYALTLEPENENYLNNQAFIFLKMGKVHESIETARKILLTKPDFDKPLAVLGEAYLLKGNYQMAQHFWQRYAELHPEDITTICALIEIYEKTKQEDLLIKSVYKLLHVTSDKGIEKYLEEITLHPFRYTHVIDPESIHQTIKNIIRKLHTSFKIAPPSMISEAEDMNFNTIA